MVSWCESWCVKVELLEEKFTTVHNKNTLTLWKEKKPTWKTADSIKWPHLTPIYIHPFHSHLSRTIQVSRYQKGKTNLDFTEARDSEWQRHQLGRMQVCTSLQTDNHASTPPLSFLQAGCPSCHPTNSVKALKAWPHLTMTNFISFTKASTEFWDACMIMTQAMIWFKTTEDTPKRQLFGGGGQIDWGNTRKHLGDYYQMWQKYYAHRIQWYDRRV